MGNVCLGAEERYGTPMERAGDKHVFTAGVLSHDEVHLEGADSSDICTQGVSRLGHNLPPIKEEEEDEEVLELKSARHAPRSNEEDLPLEEALAFVPGPT
ncbi:unnamed protein product [Effrenium voratum]|nr:unnamed protein product [Effrenium voratum]